ncbi:UHRF2-like protein [Mya arenaria]|uniref:UHRF2-like protein n=1 Tax=Mya arenaria TaxID=6604 RepID=A0ABY7G9P6_MYAAR|nr:UHRF2-like protein [Mya arenaria]
MWIQVRSFDGKKSVRIDSLSKLTKIEELRERLVEDFEAPVECQKLFYRGKQLVDGHSLFDYSVGLNDLIQLLVQKPQTSHSTTEDKATTEDAGSDKENENVGDVIDARDLSMGAWFESKIMKVTKSTSSEKISDTKPVLSETSLHSPQKNRENSDKISSKDENENTKSGQKSEPMDITGEQPTTSSEKKTGNLTPYDKLFDNIREDGFTYHVVYEGYDEDDHVKLISKDLRPRARTNIKFADVKVGSVVMANYNIEEPEDRGFWYDCVITDKTDTRTQKKLEATVYFGPDLSPLENCKLLFVDEIFAVEEPGTQMTAEDLERNPSMYCPECKLDTSEIVKAGEKLKTSKKKSKMASQQNGKSRDWGKGMACVGRQKVCHIVPVNHFGPIPGVEVGTMWKFRVQVSEAGVHRPHVAGIAGRDSEGAFSIVLSGGYEDDTDNGDSFFYTGSGGRDLSGNKRTAEQSCDQTLTRMNRALAKVCNTPLDAKNGGTAKDWRAGKPVRVVRNCKLAKHSEYAPEEEGYLEAQAQKEKEAEEGKGKKGGKRKRKDSDDEEEAESPSKKPKKVAAYKLTDKQMKMVKGDEENKRVWDEALEARKEGGQRFLARVEELFTCICCQELVYKPVTTSCQHNICKSCLQRSFKADVTVCPACRTELGKDYKMPVNNTVATLLLELFPGYDAGR